jgi:hypothetical protein
MLGECRHRFQSRKSSLPGHPFRAALPSSAGNDCEQFSFVAGAPVGQLT